MRNAHLTRDIDRQTEKRQTYCYIDRQTKRQT